MDGATDKLRSLARQTRALGGSVSDRKRAAALEALARLYEKQDEELRTREPISEAGRPAAYQTEISH